jgi:Methane oxygenase PmoA
VLHVSSVPLAIVPRRRDDAPMRALCVTIALSGVLGCTTARVVATVDGEVVHVTLDGEPFASVHHGATPRPYVFPIHGPGGVLMTRSFPMAEVDGEAKDHPHHRSLWFAHGSVDGIDFWQGTERRPRQQRHGDIEVEVTAAGTVVRGRYDWRVDDDTLVCTESRELTFGGSDEARTIDLAVTLHPAGRALVLGDTKEGTFAVRTAQTLCVDGNGATGVLTNSEGARGAAVWGKRARWIDASGIVDGRPVGIAMFDHPDNHAHPTWWHARTYGLLAANPFGVHDFEKRPPGTGTLSVPATGELRLRYRVLLHGDGWDHTRLDAAYGAWTGAR